MHILSSLEEYFDDSYGYSDDTKKTGIFSIIPFVLL